MELSNMEVFIWLSTAHLAQYGKQLILIKRDTSWGAFVQHTWKCPRCGEELRLDDCDKVQSQEVAQGAAHSCHQLDFNLRIISGASIVGINTTKVQEFLGG